jgi:hypothetical protein
MSSGKFSPAFFKRRRHPRRENAKRRRIAHCSACAVLVASAEAKFPYGVFFLPSFFFAPALPKKKRAIGYQYAVLC